MIRGFQIGASSPFVLAFVFFLETSQLPHMVTGLFVIISVRDLRTVFLDSHQEYSDNTSLSVDFHEQCEISYMRNSRLL